MACVNRAITLMVRAFINDLNEDDQEYTDERLEQLIVVAAKLVNLDMESSYTINITSPDITPDPVTSNDETFTNLVVLKSACLIDHGNLRVQASLAGLVAKAGPASLSVGGDNFKAFQTVIAEGPCKMYQTALQDYKIGNGAIAHAILSPFISNEFDPSTIFYTSNERR